MWSIPLNRPTCSRSATGSCITSVESVTEMDSRTVRVKAYRSDRNIAGLLDFPIVKNGSGTDSLIGTGRYIYQEQSGTAVSHRLGKQSRGLGEDHRD